MTTLLFPVIAYAIAYLIADAEIFGVPTQWYLQDTSDVEGIKNKGVLKVRQHLLKINFFRSQFSCYFCLGIWAGALAHLLICFATFHLPNLGTSYLLLGTEIKGILVGTAVAALIGAPVCLLLNLVVEWAELRTEWAQRLLDDE